MKEIEEYMRLISTVAALFLVNACDAFTTPSIRQKYDPNRRGSALVKQRSLLLKKGESFDLPSLLQLDWPKNQQNAPIVKEDPSLSRLSLVVASVEDVLSPAQEFLDNKTGGWALSYADLSPEDETTPTGRAFLLTNMAYAIVGVLLSAQGDPGLGLLTELASVASFIYHYTQLQAGVGRIEDKSVRLALMVDYVLAVSAIFVALLYCLFDQQLPPLEGLASASIGTICLLLCWVWEEGVPYIVFHSLWHLFSAYAGYVVGSSHLGV